MKKTILFTLLAFSLFLIAGCTNNTQDYFAKKQACSKYISQVEQEAENGINPDFALATKPEIFYSPKLDTCLETHAILNGNVYRAFYVSDLLTNKKIYIEAYGSDEMKKNENAGFEEYDKKIEELKK